MQRGFTLIEMMIAVAVLSVLMAIAIPNYASVIEGGRITNYTQEFNSTISLARSEAIKRNSDVTVCPSVNGTTCQAVGNWRFGWILFSDEGAKGVMDGADQLLQVHVLDTGVTVAENNAGNLMFSNNGMLSNPGASGLGFNWSLNKVLTVCAAHNNSGRILDVSVIGIVTMTRTTC